MTVTEDSISSLLSVCNLCVLCASVVVVSYAAITTETQRNREIAQRNSKSVRQMTQLLFFCKLNIV